MTIEKGASFADVANARPTADVRQLELTLDFCYAVQECLDAEGITRTDLARRLGKKPSTVTRILSGDANITVRTIAEFAAALDGLNVSIVSAPAVCDAAVERYTLENHERRAESTRLISSIRQCEVTV